MENNRILRLVVVLILMFNIGFIGTEAHTSNIEPLWQTDQFEKFEILNISPEEVFFRYKSEEQADVDYYYTGYTNTTQSLDMTDGKTRWDFGVRSVYNIPNYGSKLVQTQRDKVITLYTTDNFAIPEHTVDSFVVCLDRQTGELLWKRPIPMRYYYADMCRSYLPHIIGPNVDVYTIPPPKFNIVRKFTYSIDGGILIEKNDYPGAYGYYGSAIIASEDGYNYWYSGCKLYCRYDWIAQWSVWTRYYDKTSVYVSCLDETMEFPDDYYACTDEYIIVSNDGNTMPLSTIGVITKIEGEVAHVRYGSIIHVYDNNLIYKESTEDNDKVVAVSMSLDTFEDNWRIEEPFEDFGSHCIDTIDYVPYHNRFSFFNKFTYYGDRMYIQETHSGADESIIHVYDLDDGEEIDSFTIGCEANELYIVDCKLLALNWNDGILYCYELEGCEVVEEEGKCPDCNPEPEPIPEPVPDPEPEPVPEPVPEPEPIPEPDVTTLEFQIDRMSYLLDGNQRDIDVAPVIRNGRTLLPARYVTEPLGGDVTWDGGAKKVVCMLNDNTVELWIDMPNARVNGSVIPIDPDNPDVVTTIINDRTMVPMRFLAESLGCEVEWVADTKEIILTYTP